MHRASTRAKARPVLLSCCCHEVGSCDGFSIFTWTSGSRMRNGKLAARTRALCRKKRSRHASDESRTAVRSGSGWFGSTCMLFRRSPDVPALVRSPCPRFLLVSGSSGLFRGCYTVGALMLSTAYDPRPRHPPRFLFRFRTVRAYAAHDGILSAWRTRIPHIAL